MTESIKPLNETKTTQKFSWFEVWWEAITKPSVATFEWILRDPGASPRRAYLWVAVTAIISMVISSIYATFGLTDSTVWFNPPRLLVISAPVSAALSIIFLALTSGVTRWLASRFFSGSGTYAGMVYANAAYIAPWTLISSIVTGIPYVGSCLSSFLLIYDIVLGVTAAKAVNKIGWGGAVVSYIAFYVLLIGLLFCGILALVFSGPEIIGAFQNIITELGAPVP